MRKKKLKYKEYVSKQLVNIELLLVIQRNNLT